MSFFLSSPPQPTYHKSHTSHQHQQTQPTFFTPQTHRTTFFSDSGSWPSLQFQPKSPSPLRPCRNAGNVMRREIHGAKGTGDECQGVSSRHPAERENSGDTRDSFTASSITTTPSTTTISTVAPSDPSPHPQNPFRFSSQSQLSRPTTQLTSRITTARSTRRSLFLDRLRTSRRDTRDNTIIEKFEKEEYWRERKRREERMSREADRQGGVRWDGDEEGEFEEGYGYEEGLSPVDEEQEVGELVEWYEKGALEQQQQQRQQDQGQEQEDDFMDAQDFEDSDVEEAFMQVLSQQQNQQQPQMQGQIQQQSGDVSTVVLGGAVGGDSEGCVLQHGSQSTDLEMS